MIHPMLNIAVDGLLKKEFDLCREHGLSHSIMRENNIIGVPFAHPRKKFRVMEAYHEPSNFLVTGILDDVWLVRSLLVQELVVVDYKATSSDKNPPFPPEYMEDYKLQLEIYAWLLNKQGAGFPVSKKGYLVVANAQRDSRSFDGMLSFKMQLFPCRLDVSWIEPALMAARVCLMADTIPAATDDCDFCQYYSQVWKTESVDTI